MCKFMLKNMEYWEECHLKSKIRRILLKLFSQIIPLCFFKLIIVINIKKIYIKNIIIIIRKCCCEWFPVTLTLTSGFDTERWTDLDWINYHVKISIADFISFHNCLWHRMHLSCIKHENVACSLISAGPQKISCLRTNIHEIAKTITIEQP